MTHEDVPRRGADADEIRMLHVEDDPPFATLSARCLERAVDGLGVRTAHDAAAALDILSNERVDCIVSDYDMPGMDGIEFLRAVREDHPDLPFVLFTGQGSEAVASEAISAGVTDYLQKESGTDQFTVLGNRIRNFVEKARAEAELQRSQNRYRQLVDHFPDGSVFRFDEDCRYTLAGGTELTRVGLTAEEMLGKTPHDIFRDDIADETVRMYRAALDGDPNTFEQSYGGNHYRIKTIPVRDADGSVVSGMAVSQNVTEQVERERKVDRLRERTQALMHTRSVEETAEVAVQAAHEVIGAPLSSVHLVDESGDSLVAAAMHEGGYEVFGDEPEYPRDAPPGSRAAVVWDVYQGEEPLWIDDAREYEPLTEPTPARNVILHPLGDHGVFVISSADPGIYDENDVALVEILATSLVAALDRVDRETTLRDREGRLERLHEATRELIGADSAGQVASAVTAAAEDILEFPIAMVRFYDESAGGLVPVAASDSVDETLPERPVFTPGHGSLSWQAYDAGEVRVYDDVSDYPQAADVDTDLRSLIILPLGEYGTLAAGSTVAGAFSESDVFLARILSTAAEAALEAAERDAERRRQHEELAAQNERLDQFTSVVSHDLRNPLTVAQGNLDVAREDDDSDHLAEVAWALDRMDVLIETLLTLARDGKAIQDPVSVDLRSLVGECWAGVETGAARLVVETDASVDADPRRLAQLFENLFRNSVEHADPSVTVTVGALEDGFYVEDDGPGIPDAERDRVLEAGYSTSDDGTGFGLNIVEQVALAHGWRTTVTESEGGGARFEFRQDTRDRLPEDRS